MSLFNSLVEPPWNLLIAKKLFSFPQQERIASGILKSVLMKYYMYRKVETDPHNCTITNNYGRYCNIVTNIKRLAKQRSFEEKNTT